MLKYSGVGYIIQGEFTWIYVYAQIRYDEYQLYYVVYYNPFEPPLMYPLDRWWFESYISYYETNGSDIVGGFAESDEIPTILSQLYEGYDYELYGIYEGRGRPAPY